MRMRGLGAPRDCAEELRERATRMAVVASRSKAAGSSDPTAGSDHDPAPRRPAAGAAITAARTARLACLRADDRVADLASAVDAAVRVDDVVEADDLVEHDAQLTVVDEPQQVRHVVGALP